MSLAIRSIVQGLTGLLVVATLAPVGAQQIYRIVGPDGKVSFSDKPPVSPDAKVSSQNTGAAVDSQAGRAALPYALRQIAAKYPVVLYTGNNCGPCGSGRSFLTGRGIPFAEKTVVSNEDIDALQRLSGATALPFLTIGGQQLRGFAEAEWSQFLDAAGYPKSSQLPTGYRNPQAAPLVAVQIKAPPSEAGPNKVPSATSPEVTTSSPPETASNPAGIRF
ncbi:MAG: glutaredoxin family protein [Ramlibacter sp.]|nr:glutaredoxin family protein [Ramlibacter sp.]